MYAIDNVVTFRNRLTLMEDTAPELKSSSVILASVTTTLLSFFDDSYARIFKGGIRIPIHIYNAYTTQNYVR